MSRPQSSADAFTGFLAPQSAQAPKAAPTPAARPDDDDERNEMSVLAALADGRQHDVAALREETGLPLLKFARVVAALREAELVALRHRKDKELLVLTPAGRAMLGQP